MAALAQKSFDHLGGRYSVLRNIIMVATTGRSGSVFLANLINHNATNATAEHEPDLVSVDQSAEWYYRNDHKNLEKLASKKLRRLARGDLIASGKARSILRRLEFANRFGVHFPQVPIKEVYVEVNNAFLKSCGKQLLEQEARIQLVHLTRDPIEVAKSAVHRRSFPNPSRPYYLWPAWKSNEMRLDPQVTQSLSPFQLALWYWLEMELRYAALREQFPHLQTIDVELKSLNTPQGVESLFSFCGIEYKSLDTKVDTHKGGGGSLLSDGEKRQAGQLLQLAGAEKIARISNCYHLEAYS